MRTLGWMPSGFWQNNNEKSRSVSTRKSYSCFSSLWELDEQQRYDEPKSNSTPFRQTGVFPVNEEEITEMTPEFLHGFLAIGTLGSVSITTEAITPKTAIPFIKIATEKENRTEKKELQQPLKVYPEIPTTKEEETELKITPNHLIKKNATAYKKSGKLEKGLKRKTRALHFMKKTLKKLDFKSRCSQTSTGGNAIFCDSIDKKPTTKGHQKSTKIHPGETDLHAIKSHDYEAKKICDYEGYGNKLPIEDDGIMYPRDGTFLKETVNSSVFANRPINSKPDGKKAHWIKTDADYFVLEF